MNRSMSIVFILLLASCDEQPRDDAIEQHGEVLGGRCPSAESAAIGDVRRVLGSAVALDTCLKAQNGLAAWTFSSSLGQSVTPSFRVWKAASMTRATAGACTRMGPDDTLEVVLYGTESERKQIAGAVDSCLAQVAQDGM